MSVSKSDDGRTADIDRKLTPKQHRGLRDLKSNGYFASRGLLVSIVATSDGDALARDAGFQYVEQLVEAFTLHESRVCR